jgi:hypothetical protein
MTHHAEDRDARQGGGGGGEVRARSVKTMGSCGGDGHFPGAVGECLSGDIGGVEHGDVEVPGTFFSPSVEAAVLEAELAAASLS